MITITSSRAQLVIEELRSLFLSKLEDYGTADLSSLGQVTQRIQEKLQRLVNLQPTTKNESKRDTLLDIAGYAIIGTLMLDKHWGEKEQISRLKDSAWMNHGDLLQVVGRDGPNIERPHKDGDIGYDLPTSEDTVVGPHGVANIPTAVRVKLPNGYWGMLIGRSSALKRYNLLITPAVIDNGYTGELFVVCHNVSDHAVSIAAGTRLSQLVLLPMGIVPVAYVDALPQTQRGDTGFGSTG